MKLWYTEHTVALNMLLHRALLMCYFYGREWEKWQELNGKRLGCLPRILTFVMSACEQIMQILSHVRVHMNGTV